MTGFELNRFVGLRGSDRNHLCCPICLNIFNNAVISECGHIFCKECVHQWIRSGNNKCPECRRKFRKKRPNNSDDILVVVSNYVFICCLKVNAIISELRIRCDNHFNGCQTVVELGLLSNHLKECQHRMCPTCGFKLKTNGEHNCFKLMSVDRNNWKNESLKLRAELIESKKFSTELKKTFEEKEKLLFLSKQTIKQNHQTISDLKSNLKNLNENTVPKKRLIETEGLLRASKQTIEENNQKISELELKLKKSNENILQKNRLNETIEENNNQISKLELKLIKSKNENTDLKTKLNETQDLLNASEETIEENGHKISKLELKLNKFQNKNSDLKKRLEKVNDSQSSSEDSQQNPEPIEVKPNEQKEKIDLLISIINNNCRDVFFKSQYIYINDYLIDSDDRQVVIEKSYLTVKLKQLHKQYCEFSYSDINSFVYCLDQYNPLMAIRIKSKAIRYYLDYSKVSDLSQWSRIQFNELPETEIVIKLLANEIFSIDVIISRLSKSDSKCKLKLIDVKAGKRLVDSKGI